ncbi:MAG TPA: hypothetical protein PK511_07805 [Chitinophagales bacterium]|nr:hypothetical protein [Chitinophagales bacterium]HMU68862.1 hypothetical protein [Chitinophagales bacterium]HNA56912.1 hypothetical protein [Chitinophagales bacterium]HNE45297.1 hypothetical protein [Chitinophagales bacterium]HNI54408.1 hypothetical protein [Chitinophagales bacterium]
MKIFHPHIFICTSFMMMFSFAHAQENKGEGKLLEDDIIEGAAEKTDNADLSIDTYQENLNYLLQNPISINTASYIELRNSGLFTEVQIRDLRRHIESYGPLLNLYELQTIPSFYPEDIARILPFITLNQVSRDKVAFIDQLYLGDYQYYTRLSRYLETQDGYVADSAGNTSYAGNNLRVYNRFRYNYNNKLSYGFTAEKDAGEAVFGPTQPYGFDYYSAHFFKKGTGTMRALALGDFELRIGQGLMMWSGFGFGKSVFPLAIRRAGPVLDSYTSTNENRFLRGAGATLAYGRWQFTPFISYKSIDANVALLDTVSDEVIQVSAIDESGLHRTESELERKDALKELMGGFDLTWYKDQVNIGFSAIGYHYSAPLQPTISPYEIYNFTGQQLINFGTHYNFLWRNMLLFGETAMSDNGKAGTLNGVIIPLDPKMDIAILHRYFSPDYQTLYAATFSDATLPQNENGTYFGTEIKPIKGWKLSGYVDLYKHQWLEYQTDAPGYGTDLLAQLTWQPSRSFNTYVRYKRENSDRNSTDDIIDAENQLNVVSDLMRSSIRWHADYDVNKAITVKSRIEVSFYEETYGIPERGYLVFQDFNYKPLSSPIGFATRFAIFNTDSYNTRIYAYETEVLYAYSIVGLSGRGTRTYLMFTWSPFKWMDVWARVANTWYSGDEPLGSGDNTFPGNTRSDAKLQVRIKW